MTSCGSASRVNRCLIRELPGVRWLAGFRVVVVFAALNFAIPVFAASHDPTGVDFDELTQRLTETDAVGIFTKLSIKGKIDKLYRDLKTFHAGSSSTGLNDIKERFELMIQGIVLMVQSKDPELARDMAAARESIWAMLADPESFRSA